MGLLHRQDQGRAACLGFCARFDIELTTIHPGATIGPALDEDASISVGLVSGLLDGSTPAVPSNGFCVIDLRDVADLHVAALQKPETAGQRYLATSDYTPFPKVAEILQAAYPDRKVVLKTVPDWIIRLIAMFGGPARQIINDIGNEKIFDLASVTATARASVSSEIEQQLLRHVSHWVRRVHDGPTVTARTPWRGSQQSL